MSERAAVEEPAGEITIASEALAAVQTELSQLSDLFRRRLLEDRAKNALIEAVQEQARAAQDQLARRDVESLFREVLLAVDRLREGPPSEQLAESVAEELLDVLQRRDLVEIDDDRAFDPRVHEAVATVVADGLPPDSIAAVERRGYTLAGRLLRPARVILTVAGDERRP
jgi:molecular chaperone GrpE